MLGLYLHIPFCQAICSYCNFNRGLLDPVLKRRYVDALEREIQEAGAGQPVDTVFFGGGTPSVLEPSEVGRLVAACRAAFDVAPDAEVTLETNPETASDARLSGFRDAGVTRVSFGAQTFDPAQLKRLGRIHTADRIGAAVGEARRAGFDNVSLDLMFWLPGQTRESWRDSVRRAIDLHPDHLSLYLLELYPNAPLRDAIHRAAAGVKDSAHAWVQAADDDAADMYLEGLACLDTAGYQQYEISNVSQPGRESRHNLKYWIGGAWQGFGCGAHSTVDGRRWHNVPSTTEYVERIGGGVSVRLGESQLSDLERLQEGLFTGLRLTRGIDRAGFHQRYGSDPWETYGAALGPAVDAGLLWVGTRGFGLTRPGMLMANEIMTTFV